MLSGALLGAGMVFGVRLYEDFSTDYRVENVSLVAFVFAVAFVTWLVSISLLGGPIWFWLHRAGLRHLWVAAIVGALVPMFGSVAYSTNMFKGRTDSGYSEYAGGGQIWESGVLTPFGWQSAFQGALVYGVMGAVIGCLIWRVAYRRSESPDVSCG